MVSEAGLTLHPSCLLLLWGEVSICWAVPWFLPHSDKLWNSWPQHVVKAGILQNSRKSSAWKGTLVRGSCLCLRDSLSSWIPKWLETQWTVGWGEEEQQGSTEHSWVSFSLMQRWQGWWTSPPWRIVSSHFLCFGVWVLALPGGCWKPCAVI